MTAHSALQVLELLVGYVICGLVAAFGIAILWRIFDGTIDLSRLISEANGDASMSRFQLLIFTFVVALSLFVLVVAQAKLLQTDANTNTTSQRGPVLPNFPDIPGSVLSLLGISASSYLVSKGIQFSSASGVEDRPLEVVINPVDPVVHYGTTQKFTAEVVRKPDSKVTWTKIAGPGDIDANSGDYKAPPGPSPNVTGTEYVTIKATSVDLPDAYDLAVITLVK